MAGLLRRLQRRLENLRARQPLGVEFLGFFFRPVGSDFAHSPARSQAACGRSRPSLQLLDLLWIILLVHGSGLGLVFLGDFEDDVLNFLRQLRPARAN